MSNLQASLILIGGPAAVIALVTAVVYGASARRSRRYRPGRPYEFRPVWFLAAGEKDLARSAVPALPAKRGSHARGGASGSW